MPSPAALRGLETTWLLWRERLLDTPCGRGYCAVSLSSEAGETVILPDSRGNPGCRAAWRLIGAEGARDPANSQAKGPLRIGLSGE